MWQSVSTRHANQMSPNGVWTATINATHPISISWINSTAEHYWPILRAGSSVKVSVHADAVCSCNEHHWPSWWVLTWSTEHGELECRMFTTRFLYQPICKAIGMCGILFSWYSARHNCLVATHCSFCMCWVVYVSMLTWCVGVREGFPSFVQKLLCTSIHESYYTVCMYEHACAYKSQAWSTACLPPMAPGPAFAQQNWTTSPCSSAEEQIWQATQALVWFNKKQNSIILAGPIDLEYW